MPKKIEGGATSKNGKKIIGLYLTEELSKKVEERATALSIPRTAYITLAINEKLSRDEINMPRTKSGTE